MLHVNDADYGRIQKYLSLDEDGLYGLIAFYATEHERTAFSPEGEVAAGRRVFQQMRAQLHQCLCVEWNLCQKLEDAALKDTTNLVVVLGDALSTAVVGVPPILIASLLVKIGVRVFCGCSRDNE